MTISLVAADGLPIPAQQFRQAHAAMYGGGSGRPLGGRSGFRVDTPDDVLTVTATTWTLKPFAAMIDPGATTHQGMYGVSSDANETGPVDAADATYARKDILYIQINDSSAGDGTAGTPNADVLYLAGAATATPVAPELPLHSFLIGTIDVPKAGAGSPMVKLNKTRFVAAGAPLPVTLSERDALVKYDGLSVQRMDVKGRPTETWDANLGVWYGSVKPVTGAGWALTGSLHRRGGAAGTQVSAAFKAIYGGGTFAVSNTAWTLAFTLTNTGYLPVGNDGYGYFMLRAATTRSVKADCCFTIDSTGAVYIRTLLGQAATTCAAGDELSFNTVWNA